ncbi:MAG TPA: flagellar basal-body MS-ring/collar protein FliF [Gemmatimonadaceae bacterium]|nr:flagellar basal-body MS-ring/collar protein FliF [Gemmatimonadaceae bacterium]
MSPITQITDRLGGPRRALIAAVGIGVTVLVLVVSRAMSAPSWVPAVSGVPLERTSALTDRLTEASIPYKLDRGGADILVAEGDLARARVALAKGGLVNGTRPGLELFDRQTWGWNDFTQRVNYRRALEGELERTIGHMRGIERAEVHIAIAERSAFQRTDDRPSTASVLLALSQGQSPPQDVVRGIAQLVSSSVDGLAVENVSIHDETGRLWSEPNDGSATALTGRQLRMQEELEHYLEDKAEAMVSQLVGAGNVRVRVSANVNYDRVERTTHSVDPAKQALATEQRAEIVPGAQGGAGSTNIQNSYENTKSTEVFSSAAGAIKRLTVAVLVNGRRLPPANAKDTLVRFETRTAAELTSIEKLVRSAVGVDSSRGDQVSVVSQSFEERAPVIHTEPEPVPTLANRIEQYQRPALSVIALLAVVLVAFLTLRALRAPTAIAGMPQLAALPAGVAPAAPDHMASSGHAVHSVTAPRPAPPRLHFPQADTQVRDRVVATVEHDPDGAARLVKSWIKEG